MDRTRNPASPACLAARPNRQAHVAIARLIGVLALALLAMGLLAGCLAEEGAGPQPLSFATDVQPIFDSGGCYNCHGPSYTQSCSTSCHVSPVATDQTSVQALMTDLTYGTLVGIASYATGGSNTIVVAGSSDTSTLWWAVSGDSRYVNQTNTMNGGMASFMSTLPASSQNDIKSWIDGGANP